jgi:hypothetical protein
MNAITRHFLDDLARRADLAATATGGGRSYRFAATATPTVVLALVQAVEAIQDLCDRTAPADVSVSPQVLQQALDQTLATLAA